MNNFEKVFGMNTECSSKNEYSYGNTRISAITDRLLRIEYNDEKIFCDMPTQTVVNRCFSDVQLSCENTGDTIIAKTSAAQYIVNSNNAKLIRVILKDGREVSDFKMGNLGGTRRTLDMTSGKVKIGDGIISRHGVTIMDDSETLVMCADGMVKPRKEVLNRKTNGKDYYCFAYGYDYYDAVADYYKLTGNTPLIPRFAFGNWWSRYYPYKQQEYLDLMQRFKNEKIPFTVATIDMDWHWVKVTQEFGKKAADYKKPKNPYELIKGCYILPGWTGYSWNTHLFPDYKKFLNELHDNNLKVTLNLHPAVGVRSFEDAYNDFAEYMGIDPKSEQQIEFDITDKKFINGYFEYLHHGYENDGVDFWWLDWQQETKTKVDGLDPLWALNHYHSFDSKRNGKRPLILSRFAGYGSHRYPLGFSGDTGVSWAALNFQPYFTAVASNIGYSWWSHDIGGHHNGKRDNELYIRWIQFGTFSPILRLHSSQNDFLGKEPWKFNHEAEITAVKFLRLRHRLIPYIYTANRLTQNDGIPLITPMYYDYPLSKNAYTVPNEYKFGSELIVAPITQKKSAKTGMGATEVWLPEGRYTDVFTGRIYNGNRTIKMYRDTWSIPVLAKEGSIIPMSSDAFSNDWKNPKSLEIFIYRGNGSYSLYEDDGETNDYQNGSFAQTCFEVEEIGNNIVFTINPADGDTSVIPQNRDYILSFKDIVSAEKITIDSANENKSYNTSDDGRYITVTINDVIPTNKVTITLENILGKKNPDKDVLLAEFLSKVQGSNNIKQLRFSKCLKDGFDGKLCASEDIKGPIKEILNMEE